jgi:hypothetical protein
MEWNQGMRWASIKSAVSHQGGTLMPGKSLLRAALAGAEGVLD